MFGDQKTDIFKIVGQSELNAASGSLKGMRALARILVVPPQEDKYDSNNPEQAKEFFEDEIKLADSIIVDGVSRWDSKVDYLLDELKDGLIPDKKAKFKRAQAELLNLPIENIITRGNCINQVYCINWDTTLNAARDLLNSQYQLFDKSWNFTLESPPTNPHANFKIRRDGLLFTFEFFSTIYKFYDPNTGHYCKLDQDGNSVRVRDRDPSTTQLFHPVCTVHFVATLDLRKVLEVTPSAELKITVQSNHSMFSYSGSYLQAEVVQLENRKIALGTHSLRKYHFSTPSVRKTSKRGLATQKANTEIGRMLEILRPSGSEPELFFQKWNATVILFHYALKVYVLDEVYVENLQQVMERSAVEDENPVPLSELIDLAEQQSIPFLTMLKSTTEKLVMIFNTQDTTVIAQLLAVFFGKPFLELYQAITLLLESPQLMKEYSGEGHGNKSELTYSLHFLKTAIYTIQDALRKVSIAQGYEIISGFSEIQAVSDLGEISPFIIRYLKSILENQTFKEYIPNNFPISVTLRNVKVDVPKAEEEANPRNVRLEVVHIRGDVKNHLALKPRKKPEEWAALIDRNPFIEAMNDGGALLNTLSQYLSLYPEAKAQVLPYLFLSDLSAASVGAIIGVRAIRNPNTPQNQFERMWKATTNGLVIGIFGTSIVITSYLATHPNTTNVSNNLFWGQLAPTPLAIGLMNGVWGSLSPTIKERWFSRQTNRRHIETVIDSMVRFFYAAGIINITLLNVLRVPVPPAYLAIPAIPALVLTLGHYTRFRERLNTGITYGAGANFIYLLIKDTASGEFPVIPTYVRLGFWVALLGLSTYFVLRNSLAFVREFQGDPELIVRRQLQSARTTLDPNGVYVERAQLQEIRESSHERSPLLLNLYESRMQRDRDSSNSRASSEASREGNSHRSKPGWCTIV